MEVEVTGKEIVDSAIKVHRTLGPGLFESTYQQCLCFELRKRGLRVDCEILQPIHYDGHVIESGYRIDMLVEGAVVIENKTVETILPIHEAQILTYLRLGSFPLGFILNWKKVLMRDGIKRYAGALLRKTGLDENKDVITKVSKDTKDTKNI